ncbi:hypothetical protein J8J27_26325, partial [Mycobacterium tuberculosis]|nr:hypothetical protein [Mycobacterium tuberculosis]
MTRSVARKPRGGMELALKLRETGVIVFLVLLAATFTTLNERFLTVQNLTTVASAASILAIAACAQAVVLLTRNLD